MINKQENAAARRGELNISKIDAPRCMVGEGPVWDVAEQALYFIDILGKKVLRFDPASGETRSWDVPDIIGSMAIRAGGGAIVALANGVHTLDFETGACCMLASSPDLNDQVQLADGKVDRRGRFIVGSSDRGMKEARGKLYVLDPGATQLRAIDDDIFLSNGPCWSPDDSIFYHADSIRKIIYAYDYDIETGTLANRRPFASTEDLGGIPDGATVDAEGHIWSAICEGGKLVRFRPDGNIERIVEFPLKLPGSVMFGGPALDRLFVPTLSPAFMGREADPLDGSTYVIDRLGVTGLAEPRFGG
jgi:L-arabinonolactonase